METSEIKRLIDWLKDRVQLTKKGGTNIIEFNEPTESEFEADGFDWKMIDLTLKSAWWPEMVNDIQETLDFVEPDEAPEQILKYARDVVFEYIGKRIL